MSSETSSQNDIDLTLNVQHDKHTSDLSLLYPPLPDKYFEEKENPFMKKSAFNKAFDFYDNLPVKPYIKQRNLANGMSDEECGGSKHALEIGIGFSF